MNQQQIQEMLPNLTVMILREVADILRVRRDKMVKGRIYRKLRKKELIKSIRGEIQQNISPQDKEEKIKVIGLLIKNMTSRNKKEEVDYFIEGCLTGALTVDRGTKFTKVLFEVLYKIWDKIESRSHEISRIIFADVSSLFPFYCPASPKKRESWIIFFPDTLVDQSEAEIKHTIAHEFAHFKLRHKYGASGEEYKKGEKAADDLAAKWGFPKKEARGEEKRIKTAHSRDT